MKTLLVAFACCILSRPAASQQIAPLRPRFITVDARYVTVADSVLDVRARRIVGLEQVNAVLTAQVENRAAEVGRERARMVQLETDNAQLDARLQKVLATPLQKPLLLDGNFYKGTIVGGLLLLGAKLYFHW